MDVVNGRAIGKRLAVVDGQLVRRAVLSASPSSAIVLLSRLAMGVSFIVRMRGFPQPVCVRLTVAAPAFAVRDSHLAVRQEYAVLLSLSNHRHV